MASIETCGQRDPCLCDPLGGRVSSRPHGKRHWTGIGEELRREGGEGGTLAPGPLIVHVGPGRLVALAGAFLPHHPRWINTSDGDLSRCPCMVQLIYLLYSDRDTLDRRARAERPLGALCHLPCCCGSTTATDRRRRQSPCDGRCDPTYPTSYSVRYLSTYDPMRCARALCCGLNRWVRTPPPLA